MNIQELVMHPAQLVRVETIRFNAEKKSAEVDRKFDVEASTKGEIVDDVYGKSHIIIKVSNDDFYFEEEKIGIFQFDEKIPDQKSAIQFMEVQGVRILWSYIREDLYSITAKMMEQPIMLPTIDVMRTIEKAQ